MKYITGVQLQHYLGRGNKQQQEKKERKPKNTKENINSKNKK